MKSSKNESASGARNHECSMRNYFESREVYRGLRGTILVDAFRFVYPEAPNTDSACRGHPVYPSADSSMTTQTMCTPSSPPLHQMSGSTSTWGEKPGHTFYFLSHFHSDHYTGITSRWQRNMIYCSRSTAALIESQLGVPASCLFPMDLHQTYIFSLTTGTCLQHVRETPHHPLVKALLNQPAKSLEREAHAKEGEVMFAVRLITANHCPGAVMFLFVSSTFGTVLHTGDFRFNGSLKTRQQHILSSSETGTYMRPSLPRTHGIDADDSSPPSTDGSWVPRAPCYEQFLADDEALQEIAQQQLLDVLFLDNTFCEPEYRFPSQWKVTQTVIQVLHSLFRRAAFRTVGAVTSTQHPVRRQARCAVLVGCYTIGKERIALALREAFPLSRPSERAYSRDSSWRIHVSPSRYALLSTINFFEDCFQPLKACESREQSATSSTTDNDTASRSFVRTADVEDVPVLLPVEHRVSKAYVLKRDTDVHPSVCAPEPLAEDVDTARENKSSLVNCGEVDNLLSVFLLPMAKVGYQSVVALAHAEGSPSMDIEDGLSLNLSRYDQILIVEPTGWCKRTKRWDVSDQVTLLRVPYSEHCAFDELLQFVELVNPARVVPTVSKESFKKHEALFLEKAPRLRSRLSNVQPITRFFTAQPPPNGEVTKKKMKDDAAHVSETLHASAVGQKRARAEWNGASASTCTLKHFLKKNTQNTIQMPPAAHHLGVVADEDEDCQVVRMLQAVVEISDDD